MNDAKEIYIVVNSPGEIAGWLRPAIKELKKRLSDYTFNAILLPCVFASGSENRVLSSIPGIDRIIPSNEFFKLLSDGTERSNTFFLHFGGDLAYTAMLAKKWKTFAWSYQWATRLSDRSYRGYFVKTAGDFERLLQKGIVSSKISVVGDLIYDSVMNSLSGKIPEYHFTEVKNIVFMPGSRNMEFQALLPFFLKIARLLKGDFPQISFKVIVSPFVDFDFFREKKTIAPLKGLDGETGSIEGDKFVSQNNLDLSLELIQKDPYFHMASSDFIVSIPGTKTGEAACLEKPMLVLIPLNRPDQIPFVGLLGLLDWLGYPGRAVKGFFLRKMEKKFGFAAQPNILAGKKVVPELWGTLTPERVAQEIKRILANKSMLLLMKEELHNLYSGFKGASERLAEHFVNSIPNCSNHLKPYLSIIICTHNRKELLIGTLETLSRQTLPIGCYEIVVVDDGSTDGTGDAVRSFKTNVSLKYIYKDWGGRSATRNLGIKEASGEIALFTDDDIIAPEHFLAEVVRFHSRYPWSIVRGPIINITEYKNPGKKPTVSDYSAATFCTCNASAPLAALRDIGGFDETFIEYGYEDNEIGRRLSKYGLKRHFNMNAYVYHYKPLILHDDLEGAIRNSQELARSALMYYKKHPGRHTALSAKMDPFSIFRHKTFATPALIEHYKAEWHKSFEIKNYPEMIYWEKKIRRYYYMQTLIDEMKGLSSK